MTLDSLPLEVEGAGASGSDGGAEADVVTAGVVLCPNSTVEEIGARSGRHAANWKTLPDCRGAFSVEGVKGMIGAALESLAGAGAGVEPASGVVTGVEVSVEEEAAGGTGPMSAFESAPAEELTVGAGAGAPPKAPAAVICRAPLT